MIVNNPEDFNLVLAYILINDVQSIQFDEARCKCLVEDELVTIKRPSLKLRRAYASFIKSVAVHNVCTIPTVLYGIK